MAIGRNYNTLPVDKGWAWLIAAAGFIAHVVMGSSNQTNSVLFVEILKKYDSSITTGSLMFMCTTLSFSVCSLFVTTFLMPRLGVRGCLLIGGIMSFSMSVGASFAPSIGVFIVLVSMKGCAHAFIFVPAISLIPHYFVRLRSRASIVPWCGGSAASIIGPFVIRAVRKEYGVSGAYFLLAAVELNICVAALLIRPLSAYRYHSDDADAPLNPNTTTNGASIVASAAPDNEEVIILDDVLPLEIKSHQERGHDEQADDTAKKPFLTSHDSRNKTNAAVDDKIMIKVHELTDTTNDRVIVQRERRNTFFGSVLTLDSEIGTALEVIMEDVADNPADRGLTRWQQIYQRAALDLWSFRWTLFAVLPGTVNNFLISYLPAISNSQGASLDQAALLVTIRGSVDLVSRVFTGFISDTHVLAPSKLLIISQICIGIACHLFRICTSFTSLIPMIMFIGLFIGSRGPLMPLICLEVVGMKKMPQAYSLVHMLNTLCAATLNPILGVIVETCDSFVPVMHIMGTCYILCACLTALIPLFTRLDIKHGRKLEN